MSTTPKARVAAGVPTGGQFATSAHAESGVALAETTDETTETSAPTDEWLPPGAHKVVDCADCDADPARRAQPGCAYCDHGRVTTDRYGQTPWHPAKPGTQVGIEVPKRSGGVEWVSATITATADSTTGPSHSDAYATGLDKDNQAAQVYLHHAIPLRAAQAAARHGVSTPEMIEEAACEMNIGIDPSHDEVRAFLDRVDDGYLEDIASSAAHYRSFRADELRREGRTGPALDPTFDASALKEGALDNAVQNAKNHFWTQMQVASRDHWHGYTIVVDPKRGFPQTYDDTAWDKPEVAPMLPWSAPTGVPVAHVALDGTVRRVDRPSTLTDRTVR